MQFQFPKGRILSVLALFGFLAWHWPRQPEPTPQLTNAEGVMLDEQMAADLVEVFFEAARHDDIQTVDAFLSEGFSPNIKNRRGDTLLTVAAYQNSPKVVARLLEHPHMEVDATNRMGLTAVAAAAFKGHQDILRQLLEHGAESDHANGSNQTAIMFAALAGRTESVALLLSHGSNPKRRDIHGNSAESLAAQQGAVDVQTLLKAR